MIDWKPTDANPPPKDRVFLITNGWSWRREDHQRSELKSRRTGQVIREAMTIPRRYICGGVFMVYWEPSAGKEGAYLICGNDHLAPAFRFWAEANNPIAQDDVTANEVVTDRVPAAVELPHYQPSAGELEIRRFREMTGL